MVDGNKRHIYDRNKEGMRRVIKQVQKKIKARGIKAKKTRKDRKREGEKGEKSVFIVITLISSAAREL